MVFSMSQSISTHWITRFILKLHQFNLGSWWSRSSLRLLSAKQFQLLKKRSEQLAIVLKIYISSLFHGTEELARMEGQKSSIFRNLSCRKPLGNFMLLFLTLTLSKDQFTRFDLPCSICSIRRQVVRFVQFLQLVSQDRF